MVQRKKGSWSDVLGKLVDGAKELGSAVLDSDIVQFPIWVASETPNNFSMAFDEFGKRNVLSDNKETLNQNYEVQKQWIETNKNRNDGYLSGIYGNTPDEKEDLKKERQALVYFDSLLPEKYQSYDQQKEYLKSLNESYGFTKNFISKQNEALLQYLYSPKFESDLSSFGVDYTPEQIKEIRTNILKEQERKNDEVLKSALQNRNKEFGKFSDTVRDPRYLKAIESENLQNTFESFNPLARAVFAHSNAFAKLFSSTPLALSAGLTKLLGFDSASDYLNRKSDAIENVINSYVPAHSSPDSGFLSRIPENVGENIAPMLATSALLSSRVLGKLLPKSLLARLTPTASAAEKSAIAKIASKSNVVDGLKSIKDVRNLLSRNPLDDAALKSLYNLTDKEIQAVRGTYSMTLGEAAESALSKSRALTRMANTAVKQGESLLSSSVLSKRIASNAYNALGITVKTVPTAAAMSFNELLNSVCDYDENGNRVMPKHILPTMLMSLAHGYIEIASGVDPTDLIRLTWKKSLKKWLSQALDEGKEEIEQSQLELFNRVLTKEIDNPRNKTAVDALTSAANQLYLIGQNKNPDVNILQHFENTLEGGAMGAVSGAVYSGFGSAANAYNSNQLTKQEKYYRTKEIENVRRVLGQFRDEDLSSSLRSVFPQSLEESNEIISEQQYNLNLINATSDALSKIKRDYSQEKDVEKQKQLLASQIELEKQLDNFLIEKEAIDAEVEERQRNYKVFEAQLREEAEKAKIQGREWTQEAFEERKKELWRENHPVDKALNPVRENLAKAGIRVTVFDTVEDLKNYCSENGQKLEKGIVEGLYNRRTTDASGETLRDVFLVRNNLNNASRVRQVLAHETVGHETLKTVLGEDGYNKVLEQLDEIIKNDAGDIDYDTQHIYGSGSIKDIYNAVKRGYENKLQNISPEEKERILREETLAMLAEEALMKPSTFTGKTKSLLNRALYGVRDYLRKTGLVNKYNSNDLLYLLASTHDRTMRGEISPRQWFEEGDTVDENSRYTLPTDTPEYQTDNSATEGLQPTPIERQKRISNNPLEVLKELHNSKDADNELDENYHKMLQQKWDYFTPAQRQQARDEYNKEQAELSQNTETDTEAEQPEKTSEPKDNVVKKEPIKIENEFLDDEFDSDKFSHDKEYRRKLTITALADRIHRYRQRLMNVKNLSEEEANEIAYGFLERAAHKSKNSKDFDNYDTYDKHKVFIYNRPPFVKKPNLSGKGYSYNFDISDTVFFDPDIVLEAVEFAKNTDPELISKYLSPMKGMQHFVESMPDSSSELKFTSSDVKHQYDNLHRLLGKYYDPNYDKNFQDRYERGHKERYSIVTDDNGEKYVNIDTNQELFDGLPVTEQVKVARKEIIKRFKDKVIGEKPNNAFVNTRTANEYTYPAKRLDTNIRSDKMRASTELDNLLLASRFIKHENDDGHHPEAIGGWDTFETKFKVGRNTYTGDVKIKNTNKGRIFYDVTNIKAAPSARSSATIKSASSSQETAFKKISSANPSNASSVRTSLETSTNNSNNKPQVSQEDLKEDPNSQVRYSLVTDKKLLDTLNKGETVRSMRSMQVIGKGIYPPMSAFNGENKTLVENTDFGTWYQSDERPEQIKYYDKDGVGKIDLNKFRSRGEEGALTSLSDVDYAPYWHMTNSPLNDQFSSAYKRPDLITVECEFPKSELTSGYKAKGARNAVGATDWHKGPVSAQLGRIGKPRIVYLSRWCKVNRIIPNAEAAKMIAEQLKDTGIGMPLNTVTPDMFKELYKLGVKFYIPPKLTTKDFIEYKDNLIKQGYEFHQELVPKDEKNKSNSKKTEKKQSPKARYSFAERLDVEYAEALRNKDKRKQQELVNKVCSEAVKNGIVPILALGDYKAFGDDTISKLSRQVKDPEKYPNAVKYAAKMLAQKFKENMFPKNTVIVPAPNHHGVATDMLVLANEIAKINGFKVADILGGKDRDMSNRAFKNKYGRSQTVNDIGLYLKDESAIYPDDVNYIILDNVINSGTTAKACFDALGKEKCRVVCIGLTQNKVTVPELKLADRVTYDEKAPRVKSDDSLFSRIFRSDGEFLYDPENDAIAIPLSRRFDKTKYKPETTVDGVTRKTPDVRYSLAPTNDLEAIKEHAKANNTFMLAPNGKKSNLSEKDWLYVRSKEFKDKYGDWELKSEVTAPTNSMSRKDVRDVLKKFSGMDLINDETGIVARISKDQREKLISNAAVRKSEQNGFTVDNHIQAVSIIDKLFKNSNLTLIHDDKNGDRKVKIKRFASTVLINNDTPIVAHLTVKETMENGSRIYSLELLELKKLEGTLRETIKALPASSSFSTLNIKKNYEAVKKAQNLELDENGEPLPKYIDNTQDINKDKLSNREAPPITATNGSRHRQGFNKKDDTSNGKNSQQKSRNSIAPYSFMEKAREELLDDKYPIKKLLDEAKKAGKTVDDDNDFYSSIMTLRGRVAHKIKDFKDKYFNPLLKYLADNDIPTEVFNEYAYAKHADERDEHVWKINPYFRENNIQGSGWQDTEMYEEGFTPSQYVKWLEKKYGADKLQECSRLLKKCTDEHLKQLKDYELISDEVYDRISDAYENYIPLKRIEQTEEEFEKERNGIIGDLRALGRKQRANNHISFLWSGIESTIRQGERNLIYNQFSRLLGHFDTPKAHFEQPAPKQKLTQKKDPHANKYYGEVELISQPESGLKINFRTRGKDQSITVADPSLYYALNPQNIEPKDMSRIIKTIGQTWLGLASVWKALTTAKNPNFFLPNMSRDFGTASLYYGLTGENGGLSGFVKNYASAISAAAKYEFNLGSPNDPDVALLKEMMEQGGHSGYAESIRLEELPKNIEAQIREFAKQNRTKLQNFIDSPAKSTVSAVKSLFDIVGYFGETSELATRFAAYKTARKVGKTPKQAANVSKNITVNFDKMGKLFRSRPAGISLNDIYIFSNAGLQGAVNSVEWTYKALSNPQTRKRALATLSAVFAAGLMQELIQSALGGGDKEPDAYDKIPEYLKNSHLIIADPRKEGKYYMKIPLSRSILLPFYGGRMFGEFLLGKKPMNELIKNFFNETFNNYNLLGSDNRPATSIARWTPTMARPVADVIENSKWTNDKIRPYEDGSVPDHLNYNQRKTNAMLAKIMKYISDYTGGNDEKGGLADISPASLQHLWETYSGGLGRTLKDATALFGGSNKSTVDNIPVVRRFLGEADDSYLGKEFNKYRQTYDEYTLRRRNKDLAWLKSHDKERKISMLYHNYSGLIYKVIRSKSQNKEKEIADYRNTFLKKVKELK